MDQRLFFPATERNRDPIWQVLSPYVDTNEKSHILEIASGSGEHMMHFAKCGAPHHQWYPTDLEDGCRLSIQAWRDHLALKNIHDPIKLDATAEADWPSQKMDGVLCINMIHISPWEATIGLMKGAGFTLKEDGFLYLYGPYKKDNQHTAPSNIEFEEWLKAKDPRFGVRDMQDVVNEAQKNGLVLDAEVAMPANNFSLVFKRT